MRKKGLESSLSLYKFEAFSSFLAMAAAKSSKSRGDRGGRERYAFLPCRAWFPAHKRASRGSRAARATIRTCPHVARAHHSLMFARTQSRSPFRRRNRFVATDATSRRHRIASKFNLHDATLTVRSVNKITRSTPHVAAHVGTRMQDV